MDPGDPISILFTKIRTLEPENASKIIGYLLLRDLGKRDLMRLALGPDTVLQSLCLKAKSDLGLSSNTLSTPTPFNPISRPINILRPPFSQSSPRMSGNGFVEFSRNPLSPSLTPGSLNSNPSLSSSPFQNGSSLLGSSSMADGVGDASGSGDLLDEQHLGDYLSFLDDSSSKNEEVADPFGFSANNGDAQLHRRSFSASDACLGSEDPGFGSGCSLLHGYDFGGRGWFGSPSKMDDVHRQQEEMMRMKVAHQRRMAAAQLMLAGASTMPYDKGLNFHLHPRNGQRLVPRQYGEEGYCYGTPGRHEREDFMGDKFHSASRQIYLTFPADSSFSDGDVSNYFSNFGPVQDVRIPYQQKRMFGFVTFVNAETVRLILARGNPHFICDSRVLVKPYKEKGKILENRRQQQLQQQMERGNFSPCSSPSGINSRDPFGCHFGPKMLCGTPETLRREAEQADMQHAIELQRRRFMTLQLPDLENQSIHHHHRSLSVGSPGRFPSRINQSIFLQSENISEEIVEDDNDTGEKHLWLEASGAFLNDTDHCRSQQGDYSGESCNKGQETNLENILPDSFFASPAKSSETHQPESEKEKCIPLSDSEDNKPYSSVQSA
ncbi:PREDICTED: zinc finger CCCH domain-containing protein 55-like isoform X2 [Tarenaya hassleriana]|uniref:zinc finger CCCH domain-containing protein 55-like isoform X2 n=1 Tax=Tarenaya hassleriana TaxID=28532 RepID=UPI00053C4F57|nr:PREDICTED: zinc finger CCCH domain-containing protein 55-like isoform X2 [Tarenaya hassleriana]